MYANKMFFNSTGIEKSSGEKALFLMGMWSGGRTKQQNIISILWCARTGSYQGGVKLKEVNKKGI